MIDIENKVFTVVATELRTEYPNISISTGFVNIPSVLPCVTLCQIGSATYKTTQDDSLTEHHSRITFECNVFDSLQDGKKQEAKKIMNIIDTEMQKMKFTRITYLATPNVDETIYRLVTRYEAVVSEGITDGTTTTYQMYRR